jgi:hypothetical protein
VNGMMKAPEDRKRVIIFREHRQVQVHEWTLTTILISSTQLNSDHRMNRLPPKKSPAGAGQSALKLPVLI